MSDDNKNNPYFTPEIINNKLNQITQKDLKVLKNIEIPTNSLKALIRDLKFFQAWHFVKYNYFLSLPLSVEIMLEFLKDLNGEILPQVDLGLVEYKIKAKTGKLTPSTIERRLASISRIHQLNNFSSPFEDEKLKELLKQIKREFIEQGGKKIKKKPATEEIIRMMIEQCAYSLPGKRDKAILLVAFSAGGRRRSEVVSLRYEDLKKVKQGYEIILRKNSAKPTDEKTVKPIFGEAADALREWLNFSGIKEGYIFRRIFKDGSLGESLSSKTVNRIVKKYALAAGFTKEEAAEFGAHSLRSGFATQCGKDHVNSDVAMNLTGHKSKRIFDEYYQEGELRGILK